MTMTKRKKNVSSKQSDASGGSGQTATYRVHYKIPDEVSDRKEFRTRLANKIRDLKELSLAMANHPRVLEGMEKYVLQSPRFSLNKFRKTFLNPYKNEFAQVKVKLSTGKEMPLYVGSNLHESTFAYVHGAFKAREVLKRLFLKVVKDCEIMFSLFGRDPFMGLKLRKMKYTKAFAYNFVVGLGRKLDQPIPQFRVEPKVIRQWYDDLFEPKTDNQKKFHERAQVMVDNPGKVIAVLTDFFKDCGLPSDNWELLKSTLSHRFPKVYASPFRHLICYIAVKHGFQPQFDLDKLFPRPEFNDLPIQLVMSKKYVIKRPGNSSEMTELVCKGKSIDLIFPNKGKPLEVTIKFPKAVVRRICAGAVLSSFRVDLDRDGQPRIDVILRKVPSPWSTKLWKMELEKTRVVALDINRLGEHMLSFNQPTDNSVFKELNRKYQAVSDQIKQYKSSDHWQLGQLHRRRSNLLKTAHSLVPRFIASVIVNSGAEVLVTEFLTVTTRKTKGSLAKAITTMPQKEELIAKALAICRKLGHAVEHRIVNPRHVNFKVHFGCGGRLDRGPGQWDYAPCKRCGEKVNTHQNAAELLAARS
ncbi:MAG: hypothetical protein D6732_18030 [Methanobacteriota archaeon]|nr:MAG: hypothetical protein D6732_18030 [Euryarchaeota archaeon]